MIFRKLQGAFLLGIFDVSLYSVMFCYVIVWLFASVTSGNHWSTECSKLCKCYSIMDPQKGSLRKIVDCSDGRFPADLHLNFPSDTDTLNLSGNGLSLSAVLTVVDNMVSIRCLNLSDNAIEGVREFKRLRSAVSILDMSQNSITSLLGDWLLNREHLSSLNISNNKIEFIHPAAFSYMGKLQYLDLSHNGIWQLHKKWFRDLLKLERLDLSYNFITSLTAKVFQHLSRLTFLDLSHNRIRTINLGAFHGISNLKFLYLNENELSGGLSEKLEVFQKLSVLDLSRNNFRTLNTHAFINVKTRELFLRGEKYLKYVQRESFMNMPFLEKMELSNNPSLEYIDHWAFSNVPLIQSLHLEDNKLRAISNQTVGHLASVQRLFIKGNPIVCDCNIHWLLLEPRPSLLVVDLNDTVCHGPTRLTGRLLSQSLRWYVPSLCQPDIVSSFNQVSSFTFGDSLRLDCYALGNPPPDVYWVFTKDIKDEFCSSNDTGRLHPLQSGSTLTIEPLTFQNSGQYKCVAQNSQGRTEKCFIIDVEGNHGDIVILATSENTIVFTWNGTDSRHKYKLLFREKMTNMSSDYQVVEISPGMRKYSLNHLNASACFEICIALMTDKAALDRKCNTVSTNGRKLSHDGIYSARTLVIGLSIGCSFVVIACACLIRLSIKKYNKSQSIGRYMLPQSTSRQRIVSEARSSIGSPTTYENKMLELSDEECFIEESEASFPAVVT